jgi:uncharacterized membrane protein YfcA
MDNRTLKIVFAVVIGLILYLYFFKKKDKKDDEKKTDILNIDKSSFNQSAKNVIPGSIVDARKSLELR